MEGGHASPQKTNNLAFCKVLLCLKGNALCQSWHEAAEKIEAGKVTFLLVLLRTEARPRVYKPFCTVPFFFKKKKTYFFVFANEKKGHIFASGNNKQCIAMVLEILISGEEYFSEPD